MAAGSDKLVRELPYQKKKASQRRIRIDRDGQSPLFYILSDKTLRGFKHQGERRCCDMCVQLNITHLAHRTGVSIA